MSSERQFKLVFVICKGKRQEVKLATPATRTTASVHGVHAQNPRQLTALQIKPNPDLYTERTVDPTGNRVSDMWAEPQVGGYLLES